jgi:hypothetical protein
VLGRDAQRYAPKGTELPQGPVYGVGSLQELERSLTEFRALLSRWVNVRHASAPELHELTRTTTARARLLPKGHVLSEKTGLLTPVWETETQSFEEMIHSFLVLALEQVPPTALHQCDECGSFFYDPSRRDVRYCTTRCSNRAMARRHRERDPEAHRHYQRELMRRRREEGKA